MAETWQHAGNMIVGTTAERGAFDTSTLRAGNSWHDTDLNSILLWDGAVFWLLPYLRYAVVHEGDVVTHNGEVVWAI